MRSASTAELCSWARELVPRPVRSFALIFCLIAVERVLCVRTGAPGPTNAPVVGPDPEAVVGPGGPGGLSLRSVLIAMLIAVAAGLLWVYRHEAHQIFI